jgi:hypothetical protein
VTGKPTIKKNRQGQKHPPGQVFHEHQRPLRLQSLQPENGQQALAAQGKPLEEDQHKTRRNKAFENETVGNASRIGGSLHDDPRVVNKIEGSGDNHVAALGIRKKMTPRKLIQALVLGLQRW